MIQDELKAVLLAKMPRAGIASGGTHVIFRCPYCGDSRNPTSKHFYVNLGYNDTLPMFYCHLCHSSGIVTNDVLLHWSIYDIDLCIGITKNNERLFRMPQNRLSKDKTIYKLFNNTILECELSHKKMDYINSRLGSSLTFDDAKNMKIVLNLFDVLESNNVSEKTRKDYILTELDRSFLGFISYDNAFINLRNLRKGSVPKEIDKKYINYNIFNKVDNTKRFYVLPNQIDLNNPERIKIHIAEGPFDILSVFLNLRKDSSHNIYSAICGSGYFNLIRFYICILGLINTEIHVYKDNDISDDVITDIAYMLRPLNIPFYLHTNTYPGEKDWGIPIEKINEKIWRIA